MTDRNRVIIMSDHYIPGSKAGGPIRSLYGIAQREGNTHDLAIITRDRDLGDSVPYAGIKQDTWQTVGSIQVMYVRPGALRMIRTLIRESRADIDVLYLNSLFSSIFTLLPLFLILLRIIHPRKVLLAPRGETGDAALSISAWKKRPVSTILRRFLLPRDLVWHASSPAELKSIERFLGHPNPRYIVQPDPAPPAKQPKPDDPAHAHAHAHARPLQIVQLGRIVPIKNLSLTLRSLSLCEFPVRLIVVGRAEDRRYWNECSSLVDTLPTNIDVDVRGHLDHEQVERVITQCDALVLPTLGENYGHAIAECLAFGVPVMIPDTTPWTNFIRAGGGWIIDTQDPRVLVAKLAALNRMPIRQRYQMRLEISRQYSALTQHDWASSSSLFDKAEPEAN